MKNRYIAVSDWDGTLRKGFILSDWMFFLSKNNIVKIKYLNAIMDIFKQYKNNKISYRELAMSANEIYAMSLKNVKIKDILLLSEKFVKKDIKNLFNFTKPLLKYLNKENINIYIINGAPEEVLTAYKKILKIKNFYIYGLKLQKENAVYLGEIKENTTLYENKDNIVNLLKEKYKILISMGDSVSDFSLFENAEIPVAVNNTDIVLKEGLYIKSNIYYKKLIKHIKFIKKMKGINK